MDQPAFSWYDLLGILPTTPAEQIGIAYHSKASLLQPAVLSGAPSKIIAAASRAQRLLDAAWEVLGDPASRQAYDVTIGVRSGGGLASPMNFASRPGWSGDGIVAGSPGAEALGLLMALTDWLTPHPHPPRRLPVPDLRGLFYSIAMEASGRLGLHLMPVRLTEHPMPVDGLIVDQCPRPPTKVRRDSEVTVHVWHAPADPRGTRRTAG